MDKICMDITCYIYVYLYRLTIPVTTDIKILCRYEIHYMKHPLLAPDEIRLDYIHNSSM